jgi:hypothetical protein
MGAKTPMSVVTQDKRFCHSNPSQGTTTYSWVVSDLKVQFTIFQLYGLQKMIYI